MAGESGRPVWEWNTEMEEWEQTTTEEDAFLLPDEKGMKTYDNEIEAIRVYPHKQGALNRGLGGQTYIDSPPLVMMDQSPSPVVGEFDLYEPMDSLPDTEISEQPSSSTLSERIKEWKRLYQRQTVGGDRGIYSSQGVTSSSFFKPRHSLEGSKRHFRRIVSGLSSQGIMELLPETEDIVMDPLTGTVMTERRDFPNFNVTRDVCRGISMRQYGGLEGCLREAVLRRYQSIHEKIEHEEMKEGPTHKSGDIIRHMSFKEYGGLEGCLRAVSVALHPDEANSEHMHSDNQLGSNHDQLLLYNNLNNNQRDSHPNDDLRNAVVDGSQRFQFRVPERVSEADESSDSSSSPAMTSRDIEEEQRQNRAYAYKAFEDFHPVREESLDDVSPHRMLQSISHDAALPGRFSKAALREGPRRQTSSLQEALKEALRLRSFRLGSAEALSSGSPPRMSRQMTKESRVSSNRAPSIL